MRLDKNQIRRELRTVKGWTLRGKRISRLFVFDDFMQGIRFLNHVARFAEDMYHHPDVSINYNKVRLSLTTHDEGGLTRKDFRLARKINRLTK
ncbi:MAG TPA: 4a-hydroxytetrahydrobiopterin dehydratase [Candidatus Bathyarchaeia archaeon]|nr:4a-hydroxytetrahydrobiopterin dehydratase [Candidatus Bathyarchaeia archaeon]